MNRKRFHTNLLLCAIIIVSSFLLGCKKEEEKDLYQVNSSEVLPPNAVKNRLKSNEQFVAILHANLFQSALSANQVFEISQCIESVGDKELVREVIISNFMNKPGVIIPSDSAMRANVDNFIEETYIRFLVRTPTQAEKTYFRNFINANPNVTPEIVYFSFALSDEYLYY